MKKLYIFDFDGTITDRDSFIIFTFFSVSFYRFLIYWLMIIFYKIFHNYSNSKLKESFFEKNFKDMDVTSFDKLCVKFFKKYFTKIIKKSFLNYLSNIKKLDNVVIVSASIKNYLQPWCMEMNLDLICTELEENFENKITGKFSTPNCNYDHKVNRIKSKYDLSHYDEIHVFGNSKGDFAMLELGTHKYYKYFK